MKLVKKPLNSQTLMQKLCQDRRVNQANLTQYDRNGENFVIHLIKTCGTSLKEVETAIHCLAQSPHISGDVLHFLETEVFVNGICYAAAFKGKERRDHMKIAPGGEPSRAARSADAPRYVAPGFFEARQWLNTQPDSNHILLAIHRQVEQLGYVFENPLEHGLGQVLLVSAWKQAKQLQPRPAQEDRVF